MAKSLQWVLDWTPEKEATEGGLDVAGTFAVDEKVFDEIVTRELVPGGKDKAITMENRAEFVRLRIEYEFKVQCASQINSFKKGFDRLVDKPVLKHILTPYDLEMMICG